jgi:hypothetical protein
MVKITPDPPESKHPHRNRIARPSRATEHGLPDRLFCN